MYAHSSIWTINLPCLQFFCTAKDVGASVASTMSFACQSGSILQAVAQYVTKLTASIHAELYRIGDFAITPLSSECELGDLLAGWHESYHEASILPCFLI